MPQSSCSLKKSELPQATARQNKNMVNKNNSKKASFDKRDDDEMEELNEESEKGLDLDSFDDALDEEDTENGESSEEEDNNKEENELETEDYGLDMDEDEESPLWKL